MVEKQRCDAKARSNAATKKAAGAGARAQAYPSVDKHGGAAHALQGHRGGQTSVAPGQQVAQSTTAPLIGHDPKRSSAAHGELTDENRIRSRYPP
jgi:hypothetical protein